MSRLIVILFSVFIVFSTGCSERVKKLPPASTAPATVQNEEQHVSGNETSPDHLSGVPSPSGSHMSGN